MFLGVGWVGEGYILYVCIFLGFGECFLLLLFLFLFYLFFSFFAVRYLSSPLSQIYSTTILQDTLCFNSCTNLNLHYCQVGGDVKFVSFN